MSDEGVVGGAAGRADALAAARTLMAAERTLMAWIRTALAMISFGFTIYKFLNGLYEAGAIHLREPHGPRNIGLFLTALGTGSLLAGIVEYVQTLKGLPAQRKRPHTAFYVACAVVILGVVVLFGLVGRMGLF